MKKKILIFTNVFPNQIDENKGLRIQIESEGLLRNFDVKIISPIPWVLFLRHYIYSNNGKRKISLKEKRGSLEIFRPIYLTIPKIGLRFSGFFYFLSVVRLVVNIRRNFRFDLIISYWTYPDGFAASLISKILRVPLIIRPRGSDINILPQNKKIKRLIQHTLMDADRIIPVSSALKNKIVEWGIPQDKISVITSGVDHKNFFITEKTQARKTSGLCCEKKAVLFVGNFVPVKGVDILIEAIHILKSQGALNFSLYLVGSGSLKKSLIKRIRDLNLERIVRIISGVPNDKLHLWMNACDLFCLPSRNEGWPNVLMEALACGLPVVATKVGGIPEIINNDNLGILVPPKNKKALADAIETALSRKWDGEKLIGRVKEESWDKIVDKLRAECLSLINGGKNE